MSGWWKTLLVMSASGSLLGLALMALRRLARHRIPSRIFYAAWLLVIVRFLLPVPGLLSLNNPGAGTSAAASVAESDGDLPWQEEIDVIRERQMHPMMSPQQLPASSGNAAQMGLTRPGAGITPEKVLLILWLTGTLGCAGWYLAGYRRFAGRIRASLSEPGEDTLDTYISIPGSDKADLALSREIRGPMLLGLFRPVIVLPDRDYDPETLKDILLHELTHFRRRDIVWKWLAVAARCIHWFNPLWLAFIREVDAVVELSCDERLLRDKDPSRGRAYGNMLLDMAADQLPRQVVGTTLSGEKKNLKDRLEQIRSFSKRHRAGTALGAVILLALIALTVLFGPQRHRVLTVSDVDGLLAAIGSNRVITLAPGIYDLTEASDYGEEHPSGPYTWQESIDGYQLEIRDVSGLTVRGESRQEVLIRTGPRYADVLTLRDCGDVILEGNTLGHTEQPGICTGGVITLENCERVRIRGCELFGCGVIALDALRCSGVQVENSYLVDCSMGAAALESCRDVRLEGCTLAQCGKLDHQFLLAVSDCSGVSVVNCEICENTAYALVYSDLSREIYFLGNSVHDNLLTGSGFQVYRGPAEEPLVIDGCGFSRNTGELLPTETAAADLNGSPVSAASLYRMQLREISFDGPRDLPLLSEEAGAELAAPFASSGNAATAYDPGIIPGDVTVTVSDAAGFLTALDTPGVEQIVLEPLTVLDLAAAGEADGTAGEHYVWVDTGAGPELVIHDIDRLTICCAGAGGMITQASERCILAFENCGEISLSGLFIAHPMSAPSRQLAPILRFDDCDALQVEGCQLHSGAIGVKLSGCRASAITDTAMAECDVCAVMAEGFEVLTITGCSFIRCGYPWILADWVEAVHSDGELTVGLLK